MGRKKALKNIMAKKFVDDKNRQINRALKEATASCPYNEKKCFECEIQDCPEESFEAEE